jgi:hypothetical protein
VTIDREEQHPHGDVHRRIDHQPIAIAPEGENLTADVPEGLVLNPVQNALRRRRARDHGNGPDEDAQEKRTAGSIEAPRFKSPCCQLVGGLREVNSKTRVICLGNSFVTADDLFRNTTRYS